jgi:hypothetical protein
MHGAILRVASMAVKAAPPRARTSAPRERARDGGGDLVACLGAVLG